MNLSISSDDEEDNVPWGKRIKDTPNSDEEEEQEEEDDDVPWSERISSKQISPKKVIIKKKVF